jgi:hypothetical protein
VLEPVAAEPAARPNPTAPVYERGQLPPGGWQWFRRVGAVQMVRVVGPCTVHTATEVLHLPRSWAGYLAIDDAGYPVAIPDEDHGRDYTPAGA